MKKNIWSAIFFSTLFFSAEANDSLIKNQCDRVIDKTVFQICYDKEIKGARAVSYTLNGNNMTLPGIKEREKFYSEKLLPIKERTKPSDYAGSGYDRGHLAPDASFDHDKHNLAKTYSMANIVPMSPNLNRKTWIKAEKYERMIAQKLGSAEVINIVFYDKNPPFVGKKTNVPVPKSFVKKISNKNHNFEKCFLYNNEMPLMQNGKIIPGELVLTIDIEKDRLENHEIDCKKIK